MHNSGPDLLSLTGTPIEPAVEFRAAFLTAATCPTCGRFSTRMTHVPIPMPHGVAYAPVCECINGHTWPLTPTLPA